MGCCVPTDFWRKKAIMLCKRGNIETELLLIRYLEDLDNPTAQKRILLEDFLNQSDQNLFNWLIHANYMENNEIPNHFKPLITEIRDNYLNSNN